MAVRFLPKRNIPLLPIKNRKITNLTALKYEIWKIPVKHWRYFGRINY